MHAHKTLSAHTALLAILSSAVIAACAGKPLLRPASGVNPPTSSKIKTNPDADDTDDHASDMIKEGRETFRYDTFGSEQFWGSQLGLHKAVAGQAHGGVGPGPDASASIASRAQGGFRQA